LIIDVFPAPKSPITNILYKWSFRSVVLFAYD
jgi:hypothetical protein